MAATAAVTAVLLFLFTFSSARFIVNQPRNDFFSSNPSLVTLPDSEPNPGAAILLPSERPESEPATLDEIDPAEVQSSDSKSEPGSETDSLPLTTDSFPLTTFITLHPINHHFFRGSFFPIRRGHKCHGHRRNHNPHFHQLRQRFSGQRFNGQREISFGNDMIVAKDQDQGFDRAYSGEGQRLERWSRYNHGGDRLSLANDEMFREEVNEMVHPHIYHHHRRQSHFRHHRTDDQGEEEQEHRHENGIIKGIMRFLNL